VNNLTKVATLQWTGQESKLQPLESQANAVTITLPRHTLYHQIIATLRQNLTTERHNNILENTVNESIKEYMLQATEKLR